MTLDAMKVWDAKSAILAAASEVTNPNDQSPWKSVENKAKRHLNIHQHPLQHGHNAQPVLTQ